MITVEVRSVDSNAVLFVQEVLAVTLPVSIMDAKKIMSQHNENGFYTYLCVYDSMLSTLVNIPSHAPF